MGAGPDFPGYAGSLALSLVSLAVVCLVAFVGLRWLGRRGFGQGRSDSMRIVSRLLLEPRRSVYLIEVAGRYFVIGVGDGPVSLLAEIDKATIPAIEGQPSSGATFGETLARILRRRGQ